MGAKSISIRIEEEMLQKIGFVADYEGCGVNSHILVLVWENSKAFEEAHGKIEGDVFLIKEFIQVFVKIA